MNTSKTCSKCGAEKPLAEFETHVQCRDGHRPECKACSKIQQLAYRQSFAGWLSKTYSHQKENSKKRGHTMPAYSKKELGDWVKDQYLFDVLFFDWELADYDKWLRPSVDRLDDYLPYSFNNIQLITWKENDDKCKRDRVEGVNTKNANTVLKIDVESTEVVSVYYSTHAASRATGYNSGYIGQLCRENSIGHGFRWAYA